MKNTYRLLTDERRGGSDSTRTPRCLEREDVDALPDGFVTYRTVWTNLDDRRSPTLFALLPKPNEVRIRISRATRVRELIVREVGDKR